MIAKITPPEELIKMIQLRGKQIEAAQSLANHAAEQIRISQENFWELITSEYPEIKNELIKVNVDYKTAIMTITGENRHVAEVSEKIALMSSKTSVKFYQIRADDAAKK